MADKKETKTRPRNPGRVNINVESNDDSHDDSHGGDNSQPQQPNSASVSPQNPSSPPEPKYPRFDKTIRTPQGYAVTARAANAGARFDRTITKVQPVEDFTFTCPKYKRRGYI